MGLILDSSLLIAAERGALRLDRLLDELGSTPIAVAAITASELLHGCHRASDPAIRARRAAFVDALLEVIPVIPFGLVEARRHAQLWADLSRAGSAIGAHDMLIGATALARGDAVATLNSRDFSRIAGLRLLSLDRFAS
ncbi:MAG TPA: PIN domain-containing protein [Gemmatimonadales bacterium]|nr:PIN domain-containing protein [Gemmatimonadales bacterium]